MKLKIRFTTVILMIALVVAIAGSITGSKWNYYTYSESLEKVVASVDGTELNLRDMAFYVVYQEQQVEQQAYIFNPEDTGEYWSVVSGSSYVRAEAKEATMNMAMHDEIFYQLAMAEHVELSQKEETYLANTQMDFWSDLPEGALEKLGVSQEELNESMRKIAIVQKYQNLYAAMHNADYDDYSMNGEAYQQMMLEHECEVREDVWERVHFGSITLEH